MGKQVRTQLIEDLWDSIATEQDALKITDEQRDELERRLSAYQIDGYSGQLVIEVIKKLRTNYDVRNSA